MRGVSVLLLIACIPAAGDDPNVTIYPPGPPAISMFDPANPPIPLRPPEAAFCQFAPQARMPHSPQFTFDGSILTLTSPYQVSITPSITIFLPTNATDVIREHENGHARLCAYEYSKVAASEVEAAFAGAAGMRIGGRGANAQERMADASGQLHADGTRRLTMAAQGLMRQVEGLNNLFDDLTRHGTNPEIDTAKGEAMAKQQFEAAIQPQVQPPAQMRAPQAQPQVAPPAGPGRTAVTARPHRSRPSKAWAIAALVLGGLLLAYGILSYGRRV